MIGGLPHETAAAIRREIALALWIWLGCILLFAVAALRLAVLAWRSTGRRQGIYGIGAMLGALTSAALTIWLFSLVGR